MNLFLIDKNENVMGIIPDNKIISLTQSLEINQADVLNGTITLDKSLDLDNVRYFAVPDRDNEHNLWMYRKTIVKVENDDIIIQGVNAFYDDLKAYGYIKDKRPNKINAAMAIALVLDKTRWSIDFVDSALTESHDTNFYYLTYLDAIKKIEDEWEVEIQPFINVEGNKITRKYVNIYKQMGGNKGKRFVYGKSALKIVKESNDTDVYTALIGRGQGILEDNPDHEKVSYGRKLTFADVEWSKAKGDPVDKPKGQEWVEWSQATKEFGYSDGTPRFGIIEFENEQDPNNLLKETWENLQKSAIPSVQFSATVGDVGFLNLGETITVVRYDLDIKYQTRVIKIEWNRKNEQFSQITLGDKLVQTAADRYRSVQSEAYKARDIADQASSQANFAIDNGGTTVEWGSNEPKNPKEGTIWYDRQSDGTVVMKKFENGQWVILIDDTTGEQVKNKVAKAEDDVRQLKIDTDNAESTINKKLSENDKKLDDFNNGLSKQETEISGLNSQISDVDKKADNIKNSADSALSIATDAKNGLLIKVDSNEFHSTMQQVDNAIQSKVSNDEYQSKITQLSDSIQTKVSDSDYQSKVTQLANGIQSNVDSSNGLRDSTNSRITQLSDSIQTKVSNNEYQSKVTQLANGIQSNVDSINSTNGNLNDLKNTTNSSITQLNNSINTKVSNSDFISKTNQLADGISSTVAKVDGLQVGGTNLLVQSKTLDGWEQQGDKTSLEYGPNRYYDFSTIHIWGDFSEFVLKNPINLEWGKLYTASCWVKGLKEGDINIGFFNPWASKYNPSGDNSPLLWVTGHVYDYWTKIHITFRAGEPNYSSGNKTEFEAWGNWWNVDNSVFIAAPKLEEGTFDTAWSPSPKDMATQSQITQLSDNINLRVSKNDVINQINISNEGVLIDGKRTHITGQTVIDNAVIQNGMIANMSADKLTAGTIDANVINVVNLRGNNIVSGSITADKMAADQMRIGLNNSLDGMNIYRDGLVIQNKGADVLVLNQTGLRICDWFNNEEVGWLHGNSMVDANNINGIELDLDQWGDYIMFGSFETSVNNYVGKFGYFKTAYHGIPADSIAFNAQTYFTNNIVSWNVGGGYTTMNINTVIDYGQYNLPLIGKGNTGIIFGDNDIWFNIPSGRYSVNDVIHSIGQGITWK